MFALELVTDETNDKRKKKKKTEFLFSFYFLVSVERREGV